MGFRHGPSAHRNELHAVVCVAKPCYAMIVLLLFGVFSAGCATTQAPPGVVFVPVKSIADHLNLDRTADTAELDIWQMHNGEVVYVTHYSRLHGATYRLSSASPVPQRSVIDHTRDRWIDERGEVWDVPQYARTTESNGLIGLARESGLFLSIHRNEPRCRVGHMTRSDGWLIDMPLDQSGFRPWRVAGDLHRFYVFDNSDFRLLPILRKGGPNCWVFEPSPEDPNRYTRVDQFRLDSAAVSVDPRSNRFICRSSTFVPDLISVGRSSIFDVATRKRLANIPRGHVALFMDPDWLTPRLTTVTNTEPTHEPQ